METRFISTMLLAFCAAIGLLFAQHVRHSFEADAYEQISLILAGLGFAAGALANLQSAMEFAICYFGMLLTLTTLAFAWPEKRSAGGEV